MSQTNLADGGNKSVLLHDKDDINYQISVKSSVVANNWNELMTLILLHQRCFHNRELELLAGRQNVAEPWKDAKAGSNAAALTWPFLLSFGHNPNVMILVLTGILHISLYILAYFIIKTQL